MGPFTLGVLLPALPLLLYLRFQEMLVPMLEIFRYSFSAYPSIGAISSLDAFWQATIDWGSRYALIWLFAIFGLLIVTISSL